MKNEEQEALVGERSQIADEPRKDGPAGKARDAELARLDGDIRATCHHDSIHWNSRSTDDGRIITTCDRCETSWYEHIGQDFPRRQ